MYFKFFLKENKNTILIILFGVLILFEVKYYANKAEKQRSSISQQSKTQRKTIAESELLDRDQKTKILLQSDKDVISHLDN